MARGKGKKSFEEKVEENYPGFVESVMGLSVPELNNRLSTYVKELQKSEEAREMDSELKSTQELAKQMAAPYNDVKKAVKDKNKFIIGLIRSKGGDA